MASTIRCDIVSAEAEIFHGEAELIVATGELGELIAIEDLELLLAPADGAAADEPAQRAIGVHQR